MNFSMIFSAVDKATKTMNKIMATEKKMAGAMQGNAAKATRANNKTQRALKATERSMGAVARTSKKAFGAVVAGANKAGRAVKRLHDKTVALGRKGFKQIGAGGKRVARGMAVGAGLALAAYGSAALAAGNLVGTASDFENFQTILETTEGSAAKAETAMKWVQNFAVKTPYELDQVTGAFVKLRAYGLDPTQGMLTSLGDMSAAMGTPLMQSVEAMADAVMGENERLKEFGITASKAGGMVTYAYTNAAGEAATVAVKAGDKIAIQQKLMEIMNERYGGSMARMSATWDGMMGNLSDQWTKFQLMIMEAGLFDWMKGKLTMVLDTINAMEADGRLQEWATSIGKTIQTALTNIWNFGVGTYEVIQTLTGYLSTAAEYVGGWKNLSAILLGIAFAPTLISTASGLVMIASGLAKLSVALMANPVMLAIGLIAGGVYLIYKNWDAITPYFKAVWDGIKSAAATVWDWMKAAFAWTPMGLVINNWGAVETFFADLWPGIKSTFSTTWNFLKAAFAWTPLGMVVNNWDGITNAIAHPIEAAKDLAAAAWAGIQAIFTGNWLPDFSQWGAVTSNMTGIDWDALVSLEALTSAWASVTSWFGNAAAGIWDMIPEMPNWVKDAFSLFESKPQVDIEQITKQSVVPSGSLDRSKMSEKQLALLQRMDKFRERHAQPVKLIEDPKTLLAAADAASKLEKQFPALSKAADAALKGVATAIGAISILLDRTDFTSRGVALMNTLAAGIRQGTGAVVEATRAATQQVRDHLPASPAKTGPLSDIHRLKFGETIAMSIRSEPMVKAMRVAAAATMTAASPVLADMAIAGSAVPSSATQSVLPRADQARSASVPSSTARSGGNGSASRRDINVTYGNITITGGTPQTQASFKQLLAEHKREIKRLIDEEQDREDRKAF